MWEKRIACQTYHKFPGNKWAEEEFRTYKTKTRFGECVEINLAERGSFIGGKLWVREIRKKGKDGHQTSIISTDFTSSITDIGVNMFSRWCR